MARLPLESILGADGLDLAAASFTLSTAALSAGTHYIVALYNGDSQFEVSSSSPLTQTVSKDTAVVT
ncbi:MAG: Ig-like domain repeat protein, partial [Planctomycetaceae bacterium]